MNEKLDLYDDDAYRKNSGQETAPSMNDLIKTCVSKNIIEYIGTYLNYKDQRALASTCHWFNDKGYPVSNHAKHLLERVVRGDLSTVEKYFNTNTEQHINAVLCKSITITDLSKRTFPNISAFQYALWALDKPMWELILQHLPDDLARSQLRALEEDRSDIIEAHGAHFSFDKIIKRLQFYYDNYFIVSAWSYWGQRKHHWRKEVGGAQHRFPAWLIMAMCEFGQTGWKNKDVSQPVKRDPEHLRWWMNYKYNEGRLGETWACARGRRVSCDTFDEIRRRRGGAEVKNWKSHDMAHLENYSSLLTTELEKLKDQLFSNALSQLKPIKKT